MSDIEIRNVNLEDLDMAASHFKKHVEGVVDNINYTIKSLRELGEWWSGRKYDYCIKIWNTEVAPKLHKLLEEWDQKTNTTFQEIYTQYKSMISGGQFVDVNLTVDPEYYSFILVPIDVDGSGEVFYDKESVDKVLSYDIEAYLEGVPAAINNIADIFIDELPNVSSNSLSLLKESVIQNSNVASKEIKNVIEEFLKNVRTRKNEVDVIESRVRSILGTI